MPRTVVVVHDARHAVLALNAESRRGEVQHHAALDLITAPDFRDRARPADLVGVFEQVFDHLTEHSRAGILGDGLHVLHKAVALDGRGVAGLSADVRLAVVLGGDDHSVVGVLYAVLAGDLPERPRDVERREVCRGFVHRLDGRDRQRFHDEPGIVHPVAILFAGRGGAGLQYLVDDVGRRRAGPELRDQGRQAAHLADRHSRLGARLADHLIGGEAVDLKDDFRLIKIPAAVVGRNAAIQRHRDNDAGKDRFALIGHAHLVARRERQLGRVLVPRREKRRKRQLRRQRVKVIRQRHITGKRRNVARLCAVAVQHELVLVYIACRHAAHLLT